MNYNKIISAARKAKKYSHAPYSKFHVGAAVLTHSGKVFTGCNIENSSFSLTICAERTALFKAVSEGNQKFKAIAITSDTDEYVTPCGACRQVIVDLAGDIDVILSKANGKTKIIRASILLPLPFDDTLLNRR